MVHGEESRILIGSLRGPNMARQDKLLTNYFCGPCASLNTAVKIFAKARLHFSFFLMMNARTCTIQSKSCSLFFGTISEVKTYFAENRRFGWFTRLRAVGLFGVEETNSVLGTAGH